jgi:hypothetical protein
MNLYTTKFTDPSIKKCWLQINIEILEKDDKGKQARK